MRSVGQLSRWVLVTVGIIVLTSFTISATDDLRSSGSVLSGLLGQANTSVCPEHTIQFRLHEETLCIDRYENSVGDDCPIASPVTDIDTKTNLDTTDCQAVSTPARSPWTAVTYHQAKSLCTKKGARLPTAAEWYEAALGTPATAACNINGSLQSTGSNEDCTSHRDVFDMVGNAWEWIDVTVQDGNYNNRTLPTEGYVTAVDVNGIATETELRPDPVYDGSYFWHTNEGEFVMMRGGFFGSGEDAGVYATHAEVEPSFSAGAIGFRCIYTR